MKSIQKIETKAIKNVNAIKGGEGTEYVKGLGEKGDIVVVNHIPAK